MDRCESYNGNGGPLSMEVCAALFKYKVNIEAVSYMYGLAGRDFTVEHVYDIFADAQITINALGSLYITPGWSLFLATSSLCFFTISLNFNNDFSALDT